MERVTDTPAAEQSSGRTICLVRALAYFFVAYVTVTVLASGLTISYGIINQSPDPETLGVGLLQAPAFVATVPYHVLIMLVVWPAFAWMYFRKRLSRDREIRATLQLSLLWLASAVIVDYVGFVVIKNPWSLTPHEFYVEYQPWISLIYLAISLSPWIRLAFVRLFAK